MGRIVLGGVGEGTGLKLAEKGFKWERKECSWWMAELEVSLHCWAAGLVISSAVGYQGKEYHCLVKKVPCSSE